MGDCFCNGRLVQCALQRWEFLGSTWLLGGFLESLAEDPMAQKRTKMTLRISDFYYLPGNVALERAVCSAG